MTSEEMYKKWNTIGLIPQNLVYSDCLTLSRRLEAVANRLKNYVYIIGSVKEIFPTTILPVITRVYMVDCDKHEMVIFEEYEKFLKENEELYIEFKDEHWIDCELELIELYMNEKYYE